MSDHASRSSFPRRTALQALAAAAIAPGLVQAQSRPAGSLRLGYIGPARKPTAATGWALQQGYLQRELAPLGFSEVTTHVFPNGPDLNEAFLAGALDVGIYGDTPAIVARSRGLDGRLIGFDKTDMNVWLLTPQGGVKSVRELEGQVVGVPLGSYMHRYLLGTLQEAGVLGKVKVVYLLAKDAEPALAKGSLAAFAAQIDIGPLLASRGYPVIDQAAQHPSLPGTSVIVASSRLLARAPGVADAWQRARSTALTDIRQHPEQYFAFHAQQSGYPVEAIKASNPLDGFPAQAFPPNALRLLDEARQFLLQEKLIRADVDLAAWRWAPAA